jgi:Bacterial toxin 50
MVLEVKLAHYYEKGRSILEHNDAQGLLSEFAGKGKSVNNKTPGMPDYRERVDFGQFIGYYIPESDPTLKLPTNKGIIFYGNTGAHIVPSSPGGY